MQPKVLLFDFDGVVVDSFEEALKTLNSLAGKYRFNKVDLSNLEPLRELTSRQLYIETFGIAPWKMVFGVRAARKALRAHLMDCPLAPGIGEMLKQIKSSGHRMGIITSNSVENVQSFLKMHELDIFDFIISGNVFQKHKGILKCIKEYGFDPAIVYYIGDETRDIEAARKTNVKSIAVSWGFSSRRLLEKHKPDFLIDEPGQLMALISKGDAFSQVS